MGGDAQINFEEIPEGYASYGVQSCYNSAALIELLTQLTNKIYIGGGQGARAFSSSNYSNITAENNIISDHVFGRGFDIEFIGYKKESAFDLRKKNTNDYRQALDILLTEMQVLSKDIQPDLIVITPTLASELGIDENGIEGANTAIRKKYPGLSTYLNFSTDSNHHDHIHISFGGKRGGGFVQPKRTKETPDFSGNPSLTEEERRKAQAVESRLNVDKFRKVYPIGSTEALTPDELMTLMLSTGLFSHEVAAIFVALARRESNYTPAAINGNRSTKDFSFGMFQTNLLPGSHGHKNFILKVPTDDVVIGYKLAYSIDDDTNPETLKEKVTTQASAETMDPRMWIPYNQIIALAITCVDYPETAKRLKDKTKIDRYVFNPWGDYFIKDKETGLTYPRSQCGFIFSVRFSEAEAPYVATGKSVETLKSWIRRNFVNTRAYNYMEEWMNGKVFKVDKKGNII